MITVTEADKIAIEEAIVGIVRLLHNIPVVSPRNRLRQTIDTLRLLSSKIKRDLRTPHGLPPAEIKMPHSHRLLSEFPDYR